VVTDLPSPGPPDDPAAGSASSRAVLGYAGGVFAVGFTLLVYVCVDQLAGVDWSGPRTWPILVLTVLLFVGELRRLRVVRRDGDTDRLTVSATFAVALVMTGPLCLALLAQVTATAIDDLRRRRPPLVVAFNLGQYALTLTAVRAVYALPQHQTMLDDGFLQGPIAVLPAMAAAVCYFVVNNVIVGGVVALDSGQPLLAVLREDLRVQGMDSAILLGLAPITAVISHWQPLLLPLIVLPLLGVQRNAAIAASRQHESLHDDLTGLPNRALFRIRADHALRAAQDSRGQFAVMLVDLDHFKEVNDTLGHHVGDSLLREVADRMVAALPNEVTVARLGGDEFAIVVPQITGTQQVTALAQQALAKMRQPLVVDGVRLGVHASIGFAVYPEDGESTHTLLKRADIALYRAKANRGEVQGYRPDLDSHSVQRLALHGDLHDMIDSPDLQMVYQPQVEALTGRMVGFEALMRWNHPIHGPIAPDVFIPIAESTGLIAELTRFSIQRSLADLSRLQADYPDLTVAVNLSARLLSDLDLPGWLSDALATAGVRARHLTIEVTESSITADPRRAMTVLADLRDLGVRIAIDDFGTGYSSLSYLAKLQPDEVKIDKSFVMIMRQDQTAAIIVRSTIDLAHGLGLSVVAEGVEDQATHDALAALGCDQVQGYHIARPMPVHLLSDWAGDRTRHRGPSWTTPHPAHGTAVGGEVFPIRRPIRSAHP
jgi:diguanylate cyclase (GGDEF)-like protein